MMVTSCPWTSSTESMGLILLVIDLTKEKNNNSLKLRVILILIMIQTMPCVQIHMEIMTNNSGLKPIKWRERRKYGVTRKPILNLKELSTPKSKSTTRKLST
jgi:hypothetical protein